jgi:hypothetical protein
MTASTRVEKSLFSGIMRSVCMSAPSRELSPKSVLRMAGFTARPIHMKRSCEFSSRKMPLEDSLEAQRSKATDTVSNQAKLQERSQQVAAALRCIVYQ